MRQYLPAVEEFLSIKHRKHLKVGRRPGLLAGLLSFSLPLLLPAQTWTNTTNTAQNGLLNWGTAANWNPNTVPNGIDSVALFTNSPNLTINNGQCYTNGTLTAPNSGLAWIVKYGTGTNYLQVSSGIPTLNVGVSGTTAWFQGAYLGGTQGFLKTGAGKLTFRYDNNVNSISGPIILGAGTLGFQIDGNFGNPNNGLTLSNGTYLVLESANATPLTSSLAPTRTITLAGTQAQIGVLGPAYTLVIPGVISENSPGSGLLWNSAGEMVLSNANTFTGPMTMTAGTNDLANANAVQFSTMTVNGGTLLFDQAVAGNAFNFGGLAGNSGSVTVPLQNTAASPVALTVGGNNASTSFAGNLSGAGSLTKAGAGTLTFSGANSYSGNTTITAGTLALGSGGSINNSSALAIAAGATYDVSAINAYALSGSTSLTASANAAAAIIKGAATGTVNLGSQPITLNYDGTDASLVISQGTLTLGGQTITVNTPSPLANGIYNIITQTSGNIAASGVFTLAGTAGTGTLAVNGANVQMTIGPVNYPVTTNTWTGAAGDNYWGTANNWSPVNVPNSPDTVVNFNITGLNPTVNSSAYTFGTLNSAGGALNGAGSLTAQVSAGTPTINVASGQALYFYTTLNGNQGYTKTGAGTLTFRYSDITQPIAGNITIAAGKLGIQDDFSLGNVTNNLTIAGGALLSEENSSGSGTYTLSPARTLTLAGTAAQIAVASGETLNVPGIIQDSPPGRSLLFNSPGGTLVLAGTNAYSGGTTVSAGTLSVSSAVNLGAAGSGVTLNGGTLQITGTSLNSFAGSGHPATFSSGQNVTLDINNSDNTFTANSVLSQGVGGLNKLGAGTLLLAQPNSYTGPTAISAGTLALGANGSINGSTSLSIAAGSTFDVSAMTSYILSGNTTLTASGNSLAATINGNANGTVNLGSCPITLNYDGSDPALVINQGNLSLSGQTITVNSPTPLANGTYNLIQANSGFIVHSGNYLLAGNATNDATGAALGFVTNAGVAYLTLTVTGSAAQPITSLSSNQADAFELYLLNNQSQFPYDATTVPNDDTSVGNYLAALGSNGKFSNITYPVDATATVVQEGAGWETHLQRLVAIYHALISPTSAWRVGLHPEVVPNVITATTAYTQAPWDITDQWNYVHTWADLNEVYDLGSVCLYARQVNRLSPGLIPVSSIDAWGNRIPDLFRGGHIDTTYMVPSNGVISAAHQANLLTGGNMIWTSQGIVLKYLTQSTNAVRLEGLDATFNHIWTGCSLMGAKHESPEGWPVYTAIPQMTVDYMLGEHYTPYLLVYGGAFLNGMIQWRNGMANFPRWSMPPADRINQLFADCMINGVAPVNQGYPDRVLLSRGLTVGGYYSPTDNLNTWLNDIIGYGYRTNELQQLLTWNNNNRPGATPWPFTNHTFTHFYTSDYSCQHFPNYLVTFRGISQRTSGIENLQNPLAGYFPQGRQIFVPLGGSYIYATGNEYGPVSYTANSAVPFENSFDYTRVPGVTTKTVPDSAFTNYWRYVYGNTPFAGTAAANNSGVSGWEQARYVRTDQWTNAISLSGNSAVFYLDTAVVHLGAGFDTAQDSLPTTTSLNQCLSASNTITYGLSGSTLTIPGTGGGVTNAGINWALYQGVGYLPPANGTKVLRDVTQNGLARMFSFYDDQSSPATNNLCFDWAVLPGINQTTLASYATPANRPWTIVTNTAALQALFVPSENWLGAVFHTNTATLYAPGLTVGVSRPTVLLITTQTNQIATIYAADPYENMVAPYTNTVVPFTNSAQLVSQVTVTINGNAYPITLPQWPYIGKTAVATVSLSSSNVAPIIVTQPVPTNAVAGNVANFTVTAAGMPAPTYQWQRNNTNIAGATSPAYSLTTSVGDNGASFTCVVGNSSGSVTSSPALLSVNDTPTITGVPDQGIFMNSASPPLAFTVNDQLTAPGSLLVTATSSNPTLVPNANLALGGSGGNRTLTVTPAANQTGYTTITLNVSDGSLSASTAFMVTVSVNNNLPPVLSPFANQALIAGANLSVPSQANDPNVPPQPLGFVLPVAPAGASINPVSGLITWRPLVAQGGTTNRFTVVVTNTSRLGATQNFWVGVIAPRQPVISGPNFLAGHFHFTINGDTGPDYTIQGTTNLALPAWQSLSTSNAPVPPFQWTDTNAAGAQIYYRVLLGP